MLRKHLAATFLLAGLAGLLVAGCGGDDPTAPGVADLGTPTANASAPPNAQKVPKDRKAQAVAYSKCMRANGVKNFPDPNSDGEIQLHAEPGSGMSADDPAFKKADQACKYLMPAPTVDRDKIKAANLKYSKCMRANGIKSFPDPKADGTLQIQNEMGGELDPTNPKYQKADKACVKYLPDGGGERSTNSENG